MFDKQGETLTHSAKSGLICHGRTDASFVPTFLHIPLDEPWTSGSISSVATQESTTLLHVQ